MLTQLPEKTMHLVRWLLAIGWLTLILSLFYDPLTPLLTNPNNFSSPFHINPDKCVKLQGTCLEQQTYAMGASIFWGMIVPIAIVILLVLGHEVWRRICPLYFLSQIARALGIQRKRKVINPETGSTRYELAGVEKESWLGRNHLYLQIGLFYLGLNFRILFVNSDRLTLGLFLLLTIISAITVGFLFKGRSWCQYFCPMAPVQTFFTGSRGLLGTDAHLSPPQSITQSMCRTVEKSGQEKSACVSCQSPCIDIDAERSYWEGINRRDQKLLFYSYFGLMFGFFFYHFLYAGNWDYYFSGAWTHEAGQLSTIFSPGFYIFEQAIPIPKLIAAPLTIAGFAATSYYLCQALEKAFRSYLKRHNKVINDEQILHICFVVCTFISFNVFFIFGGRSTLQLLPSWIVVLFNWLIVLVSTLWLYRSLFRSKERYARESLADSLRRQLNKLAVDWVKLLDGRSLKDLLPEQVHVLAKVIPGFSRTDRLRVYKGVLQESLEEGKVHSANSLEILKDVREELSISEEEHYSLLKELGIEDPSLLDPQKQRTREAQLRLEGYRRALESLLLDLVQSGTPLATALERKQKQIIALRQEYAITAAEQEQVLAEMFNQDGALLNTAEVLLAQLQDLTVCCQALSKLVPNPQAPVYILLRSTVAEKQKLIITQLLSILEMLGDIPEATNIANYICIFATNVVQSMLELDTRSSKWEERLNPKIFSLLSHAKESVTQATFVNIKSAVAESHTRIHLPTTKLGEATGNANTNINQELRPKAIIDVLLELLQDLDPLVQSASLYALHLLDANLATEQARQILNLRQNFDWLVQETAANILGQFNSKKQSSKKVPTLIAQIKTEERIERKIFQQPIVKVGRNNDNDIVIADNRVSRQHAIFYLDETGLSVKDLGSANGLRIGSELIHDARKQLTQGDIIQFSASDEIVIVTQWEMAAAPEEETSEYLGTLEKLLWFYQSNFFQGLKAIALIELARNTEVKLYHSGEPICQMGEPIDEVLVLTEGEAQVQANVAGKEQVIQTLLPGQTIGELGVLTHTNHSVTVVATAKTKALVVKGLNFETALRQDPLLASNLLVMVSTRLQEVLNQTSTVKLA